jgi:deoxyxylulose-5-phosphate synthase
VVVCSWVCSTAGVVGDAAGTVLVHVVTEKGRNHLPAETAQVGRCCLAGFMGVCFCGRVGTTVNSSARNYKAKRLSRTRSMVTVGQLVCVLVL